MAPTSSVPYTRDLEQRADPFGELSMNTVLQYGLAAEALADKKKALRFQRPK